MTLPIDYNTVPVTGRYVYLDGTPAEGTVRFTGKVAAVSDSSDTIILPGTITVPLKDDGSFSVNLPATNDPDIVPNGWTYKVEERFNNGGGRTYEIDVPYDSTGIDLSEVAPLAPATGDPTAFVTLTSFESHSHSGIDLVYAPRSAAIARPDETIISNFQAGDGWYKGSAAGTVVEDTSTFARGTQSLKVTTPNDGLVVFAELDGSWNFSNKQFKLYAKVSEYQKLTDFSIFLGDSGLANYYRFNITPSGTTFRTGDWCIVTLNPGEAIASGAPDWSAIQKIRVRAGDAETGPVDIWLGGFSHFPLPASGVVSITFDDSYASDYTHARPVMDSYGFRGVSYNIPTSINQPNKLTLAQAQTLQNLHGWDMASHGLPDLTTLTAEQLRAEFSSVKKYMYENGLSKAADHYAFPMGSYNTLVQSVVKEFFASARTIDEYMETTIPGDPYRLRIMNVTNTVTTAQVASAVQAAAANNGWLILVYHQIVDSNADVDTKVLMADFQQNMADIAATGIAVKTVSEVISGM